ncbi:hypothetical protein KGF57_002080 [Candida theae]|uniref:Uncharacterized protein n=1 Tax=Candida theae TaxID=1198502 RepID=A0AAD5BGD8_9ASCO|nr:uncharacterized protein KGF57_002080 [Candida theae]KAI5959442.1 hypothetical protein KGF57_002080 [Candida theae]
MRPSSRIAILTLLIASITSAIVAPLYGQAEVYHVIQEKMYQPADMAGENIAKTFAGGDPPAMRTSALESINTSASTSVNGTSAEPSASSVSNGSVVMIPAWISIIYLIVNALLSI